MKEGVALHGDDHQRFAPQLLGLNLDAEHIAHGGLALGGNRHAEALEVVLADKVAGRLAHGIKVKLLGDMPTEIAHQQRGIRVGADEVAVLAHSGREARRETRRLFLQALHRDVVVGKGIQRAQQLEQAAATQLLFAHLEVHHLPARMHTRIGAAGAHGFHRAAEQQLQRLLDAALHGKLPGLAGEAGEGRTVVRHFHG